MIDTFFYFVGVIVSVSSTAVFIAWLLDQVITKLTIHLGIYKPLLLFVIEKNKEKYKK